ncbi:glycoside hydrolase family 93 protein [Myriangium duriaei CBS 260.36]|uniref:Glycoside hydrolase family 93 protein n=1 Tax=Myriangium duriaei CBS 260.36 TaxID=1168546 RepID=A0A9P4MFW3_9PEZI|nr:glycoside hydrolase family 93 protein [Myriangium duriaei CBS 260.36]
MVFPKPIVAALAGTLSIAPRVLSTPLGVRSTPAPWSKFNDNAIFYPGTNYTSWRTLYARTLQLPDQSILLTWEDYDNTVAPDEAYFPIYRSTDGGTTFQNKTRVYDQVNGWGNRYQPFLFTLPQPMGDFDAGTILLAGASVPSDLSQAYIDLYVSSDAGSSWEWISHIAYGSGPETVDNGNKAVWEPFLLLYNSQLVCYYSDQTDPAHAQKLVLVTTTDLKSWSAPTDVVAQPNYGDRPGMATVAYSEMSKKYVLTFEYCGGPNAPGCPVYHKVSDNPLEFGSVAPLALTPGNTNGPNGSPYVIWTPSSSGEGIFVATGSNVESLYVNTDAVDPNGWMPVDVGQWAAYSRSLRIISTPSSGNKLLIANGGNIGCAGSCYNYVADGVVDIPVYPAS